MITHKDNLLAAENQGDHALRLSRLGAFVDKDRPEFELGKTRVASTNTRAANDIGVCEDLALCGTSERLELLLILAAQFSKLALQLHKLVKLDIGVVHADLFVQGEEANLGLDILARLGSDTNDFETGEMDALGELINSHVRRCANKHLTTINLTQVVDDSCRCHSLASTGRTLDQTKRLLQDALNGVDLRAVEFWETRNTELARHLSLHRSSRNFVTKEAVEDVARNTHLVDGEGLHGVLHTVERGGLPDVIGGEVVCALSRNALVVTTRPEFDTDLVALVVGDLDNVANALPVRTKLALVAETHLVAHSQFHIAEFQLGENEGCQVFVVQTEIPTHDQIVLGLRLLQLAIVVRLNLNQRAKNVLVLVGIIVAQQDGCRLVVDARVLLEILNGCIAVVLPHLFKLGNDLRRQMSGAHLFLIGRCADQPRQERAILNQRLPA